MVMIGFLVRSRVRIKMLIRVRVGVTYNVRVYHWSNSRRSRCRTFLLPIQIDSVLSTAYIMKMFALHYF